MAADSPSIIPRNQWARFVTGADGEPIEKLIIDLEDLQKFSVETLPAKVDAAQATADAAAAAAAVAIAAAAAAATRLDTDTFITLSAEADLPQHRRLVVTGPRLSLTDGGPGTTATIALEDQNVILPADVSDNTGAFVDATGLLGALVINSTYMVEGALTFQSAGLGVGIGLAFTLPAGATINGGYDHFVTATTKAGGYNNAAGAVSGNTVAVPVINSNNPIHGRWIIKTAGTAGNAQLRFRSSAAATLVTLKQDLSALVFQKIG